ncbi:DNA adenine methylase [Umezakia ovalisporum]|uniref:site-specific DNA-methyltransferase (adenine-specific) n=2 Tax=Umezakia ovalisporum TaxID=75695 RepID=A0AA43GZC4_9CYAN|nr:DNA adenine methylase [Umezakia ovalisporum]MDH6058258.1 DNA adenine methylase [Umezakia ovalisporum FSS-43]MDH6063828.1 DNA adenine methylase [Umezakia ovalisporum FSS-62]MDH6066999.1 DNA adenine methylase [Umezakia ovalisporum APH033B]MDH6072371.1 DNA adenine methylase [Umezakia ovalisporum CobakiLakeA]MDH6076222.1 DNA adenine methylase [Umezakia ovalisporum CS-1034]
MLKSPLRYPGGKQKAIPQIAHYLLPKFKEFREPFVGGGSVFFHVSQKYQYMHCWVNDLNRELYYFWHQVKTNLPELVESVWKVKKQTTDGRTLFKSLATADTSTMSPLYRAVRFFVLNRITFSGTIESGGYSGASFKGRFTDSSIERLAALDGCFINTRVTNFDYSTLLTEPGEDVFIFLDPPYFSKSESKLYGKKGDLHKSFDHSRFAKLMAECSHKWLITYDNCEEVRRNFAFAYIYEWELQYGMNNYKQQKAGKGKELFITNYPVESYNLPTIMEVIRGK